MDTIMNHGIGHLHGNGQQTSQNQSQGMQTIYCSYCSVQLSFPRGSMYIQCPKCQATQNPHAPQQTVCIGCGTLLAHPSNSLYIQCPKCLITMNARENRANVSVPSQPGQTGSASGNQYAYSNDGQTNFNAKPPKKKKDPNAPKAASNAYMIFCKERRSKLKKENPSLPFGKIGAKLGEIWRNLTADEKRPYEESAAADRERYRKEMDSYKTESETGGAGGLSSSGASQEQEQHQQPQSHESHLPPLSQQEAQQESLMHAQHHDLLPPQLTKKRSLDVGSNPGPLHHIDDLAPLHKKSKQYQQQHVLQHHFNPQHQNLQQQQLQQQLQHQEQQQPVGLHVPELSHTPSHSIEHPFASESIVQSSPIGMVSHVSDLHDIGAAGLGGSRPDSPDV